MVDNRFSPEDIIRILNHHRHDWMNDLQVLFGYIQLNKQDKLRAYAQSLTEKLYRESLVSRLGVVELVLYFAMFRTEHRMLTLTVNLERELDLGAYGEDGKRLAAWIMKLADALAAAALPAGIDPNELVVTLDTVEEEDGCWLTAVFTYTGTYDASLLIAGTEGTMEVIRSYEQATALSDFQDGAAKLDIRLQVTSGRRGERNCS